MSWISILYKVYFQSHGQRRGMVLNVLHEQTQERKAVKDWGGGDVLQSLSRRLLSVVKRQVSATLPDKILHCPQVHVWIQNLNKV